VRDVLVDVALCKRADFSVRDSVTIEHEGDTVAEIVDHSVAVAITDVYFLNTEWARQHKSCDGIEGDEC